jgi:hypothetical protein
MADDRLTLPDKNQNSKVSAILILSMLSTTRRGWFSIKWCPADLQGQLYSQYQKRECRDETPVKSDKRQRREGYLVDCGLIDLEYTDVV